MIEVFLLNIVFKVTDRVIMLGGSKGGGWPIGYTMVDEVEGDTRYYGFIGSLFDKFWQ